MPTEPATGPPTRVAAFSARALGFVERHYAICACAVLALAAFNLSFRLGQEFVTEWDESLYAISAWEAVTHGNWIGTTFLGEVDYYNTKPPLNIWLIALSFKAFGASIWSLRLASALSAWLTIAVLQYWTKRLYGPVAAVLSSVVLATLFGFYYVHSARTANTDAIFTLLMVLIVVTLWADMRRPSARIWLGPLLAAAFLLRGLAVLMPLALVMLVLVADPRERKQPWLPTLAALALFVIPSAAWAIARFQVDGTRFFERMIMFDFVGRTAMALEGHRGGPFYYLNILQKHHYDWLLAAAVT